MSTSTTCQKCGTLNAEWAKFCAKCGNPLAISPPSPASSPSPPPQMQTTVATPWPPQPRPPSSSPPWYTYTPQAAYEFQNRTAIDRTKTGLILLIIGVLLTPVPYLGIIGGILALIGAILVILGRNAFGPSHSRNTIWSIIIYIIGGAITLIGFLVIFGAILSATVAARNGGMSTTEIAQAITSSFNTFLVLAAIGGAVSAIAYVLFTYAIQNQNGRIILWAAYASEIVVTAITSFYTSSALADVVQRATAGGTFTPGPISNLQAQFLALGLLNFIPAALYSTALYLVWSRISRGELPARTPASPSPTFSPPAPPTPPTTIPPGPSPLHTKT